MLARAGSPAALGPGHARLLRVDVKPRQRQAAGKPERLVVAPGDNHFDVNETPASPYVLRPRGLRPRGAGADEDQARTGRYSLRLRSDRAFPRRRLLYSGCG
jgi:hypothetical protein